MTKKVMLGYVFFFLFSFNLFSETSSDKSLSTLIIADFTGKNVDSTLIELINDTFTEAIHKTKKFILVNRDEVERIMREAKFQQTGMCDSTSCYAEIGSALGAEKMMIGNIVKFENVFRVQVKLIDISKIIEEKIESFTCVYDVPTLLGNISDLAYKLSGVPVPKTVIQDKVATKQKEQNYGSIKVKTEPENAEFYLDGKFLGITPGIFKNVSEGKHTFVIKLEGYNEIENYINVVKDKEVELFNKLLLTIDEKTVEVKKEEASNKEIDALLNDQNKDDSQLIIRSDSNDLHQEKSFAKKLKFEISTKAVLFFNDQSTNTVAYGGETFFHISENLAIGGYYLATATWDTQETKTLKDSFGIEGDRSIMKELAFGELHWAPIYNKATLLGKKVLHYDFYFATGFGMIKADLHYSLLREPTEDNPNTYEEKDEEGWERGVTAGAGARIFITKWLAFRLDIRDLIYKDGIAGEGKSTYIHRIPVSVNLCFFFP